MQQAYDLTHASLSNSASNKSPVHACRVDEGRTSKQLSSRSWSGRRFENTDAATVTITKYQTTTFMILSCHVVVISAAGVNHRRHEASSSEARCWPHAGGGGCRSRVLVWAQRRAAALGPTHSAAVAAPTAAGRRPPARPSQRAAPRSPCGAAAADAPSLQSPAQPKR